MSDKTKILFLILKSKWFYKIKSGEKKYEYRIINDYWEKRIENKNYDFILFQKGYSTKERFKIEYLGFEKIELKHELFSELIANVYSLKLGNIIN